MTEPNVEAARTPDRDALQDALAGQGVEAHQEGETGLVVDGHDGDLLERVEHAIAETGLPLVAQEADGAIHVRTPGD